MNTNIAKTNMSASDFTRMAQMIENDEAQNTIINVLTENQIHDYENIIHDDYLNELDTDSDGHVEFNGFDSEGYIEHYSADKNTDGSWSYTADFNNTPMIHLTDEQVSAINKYFNDNPDVIAYNEGFGVND